MFIYKDKNFIFLSVENTIFVYFSYTESKADIKLCWNNHLIYSNYSNYSMSVWCELLNFQL